jgi:hypothetical protein
MTLVDFQIAEYKEVTVADPTGAETNLNVFASSDTIIIEGRHLEWVVYRAIPPEGKLNTHTKSGKASRSIGSTQESSESWENSPEYVPLTLYTKEIRIEMYIEGDSNNICNYRDAGTGTLYPERLIKGRVESFNNTQIVYKMNQLDSNCQNGFIKMDISFDRVLYGGKRVLSCSSRTPFNNFGSRLTTEYSSVYPGHEVNDKIKLRTRTSRRGITIGKIGCPATCIECGKSSSTDIEGQYGCLACQPGYVLAYGTCLLKCPDGDFKEVALRYYSELNGAYQFQDACVKNCPAGYFQFTKSDGDSICAKCHYKCSACSNTLPNHCIECFSEFKYYSGHCVRTCPPGTTDEGEFCLENSGSGNEWLVVSINPKGQKPVQTTVDDEVETILSLSESAIDFFSANVFYNGTATVNTEWNLIVEDLDLTDENKLRDEAFENSTIRIDTLNTIVDFQNIDNFNRYRNRMTIEIVARAGSNYRTDYLTFRMLRRPTVNSFAFTSTIYFPGTDA